ncbi:MAG: hypothetical protein ACQESN_10505 [Thermotogota bacterium]
MLKKTVILISCLLIFSGAISPLSASKNTSVTLDAATGYDSNYQDEVSKNGSLFYNTKIDLLYKFFKSGNISSELILRGGYKKYAKYSDSYFLKSGPEIIKNFDQGSSGLRITAGIYRNKNDETDDYNLVSAYFFYNRFISSKTDIYADFSFTRFNYINSYNNSYQPDYISDDYSGLSGGWRVGRNRQSVSLASDKTTLSASSEEEKSYNLTSSAFINHSFSPGFLTGTGVSFKINNSNFSKNSYKKSGFYIYSDFYPLKKWEINLNTEFGIYDYHKEAEKEYLFSAGVKNSFYYSKNSILYVNMIYDKLKTDNEFNNFESMEIKCGISFYY